MKASFLHQRFIERLLNQRAVQFERESETKGSVNMAEQQRTLSDYARPSLIGTKLSIMRPIVGINNFEIKPNVIQMVQQIIQFDGVQDEDPNIHIKSILAICDTFKINGTTDDFIRLRLFLFSLRNKAKQWLPSLPWRSITIWDQMVQKFLAKYFPPAKSQNEKRDLILLST